jgi:F-type H+-transporting ATPase subunit b
MLQRLASPDLTSRLVELFLEDLQALPDSEQIVLSKAAVALTTDSPIEVLSAHDLTESEQTQLSQALTTTTGKALSLMFKQDAALIAGVRVTVGECLLHANLADELAFFKRQNNHG